MFPGPITNSIFNQIHNLIKYKLNFIILIVNEANIKLSSKIVRDKLIKDLWSKFEIK